MSNTNPFWKITSNPCWAAEDYNVPEETAKIAFDRFADSLQKTGYCAAASIRGDFTALAQIMICIFQKRNYWPVWKCSFLHRKKEEKEREES